MTKLNNKTIFKERKETTLVNTILITIFLLFAARTNWITEYGISNRNHMHGAESCFRS